MVDRKADAQPFLARLMVCFQVRVPIDAVNEEHARDVAQARLRRDGLTVQQVNAALADASTTVHLMAVDDYPTELPAMELPIEYEPPRVR